MATSTWPSTARTTIEALGTARASGATARRRESRVVVCPARRGRRWCRELSARQHDRDTDGSAVQLSFVHVCDGRLGVGFLYVENVGGATVGAICSWTETCQHW